jgi:TetR/AcrR family transcriptional regulator, regulator of cefoperazone and chloramphenicol sensitivity
LIQTAQVARSRKSHAAHAQQAPQPADARARLIEAALDIFGRRGFDGASTRELARQAGVNLAAIPYYFGGKDGLYLAVARHIAAEIGSRMGDRLAGLEAALAGRSFDPETARAMLIDLIDALAGLLLATPDAERWARFVLREQLDPSPAFEVLYEAVMSRGHRTVCRLLGIIGGTDPEATETKVRAFTIMGQVLVFRAARALVARRLDWPAYSPERVAAIRAVLRANLARLLDGGPAP